MIVPFGPGGTSDIVGRAIGDQLAEQMGQAVVIDNRPGGGTMIGTSALAKSSPDGYTIMLVTPDFTVNPSLHPNLPYDALKDFTPIAMVASYPMVLVKNPALPAKSVQELIALAKSKPGVINYASAGNGSMPHLCAELMKSLTGMDIVHVPYKGNGPAITDLLGGRVQLLFTGMPPVAAYVKSGKLVALASTGKSRMASEPSLPTLAESGVPGYEVTAWYGFLAPAGTPEPIIARLNAEIAKAMQSAAVRQRLASLGAELHGSTPAEYDRVLRDEIAKWGKVIKDAQIQVD
jgi:tripartite-type tricarboxylate transporter receptor subunit TctC